jgi:hypothetical protein
MASRVTDPVVDRVAEVHISAAILDADNSRSGATEEALWKTALEVRYDLYAAIRNVVEQASEGRLGVVDVRMTRGSVDLAVILNAATGTYLMIANWKQFVEGLELIRSQLATRITEILGPSVRRPYRLDVQSRVLIPVEGVAPPVTSIRAPEGNPTERRLVTYLMGTNAVMLAVLIAFAVVSVLTR